MLFCCVLSLFFNYKIFGTRGLDILIKNKDDVGPTSGVRENVFTISPLSLRSEMISLNLLP